MEIVKGGFRRRDSPLSADYRPMYKIGLLLLILKLATRGNKSSLNKLHFIMWALKSEKNMAFVRLVLASHDMNKMMAWGVEPALNKALNIAHAENLITLTKDKYSLTEKGAQLCKIIIADNSLFNKEKAFLSYLGKQKVTEEYINTITENFTNK